MRVTFHPEAERIAAMVTDDVVVVNPVGGLLKSPKSKASSPRIPMANRRGLLTEQRIAKHTGLTPEGPLSSLLYLAGLGMILPLGAMVRLGDNDA
jgi:hypothetical protein